MALAQVLVAAAQIDAQRIGYQACSLTNFDNALEPAVAAGSCVEVGGALYEAAADEAIAGLAAIAADSDVYIKLTVAGASVTASGTVVAPTWDTAKQGWYSGAERYIGGLYKDAGGNYTLKYLYEGISVIQTSRISVTRGALILSDGLDAGANGTVLKKKVIDIGDWNMDTTASVTIAHGMGGLTFVRTVSVILRTDTIGPAPKRYQLPYLSAGPVLQASFEIENANIVISRLAGGLFDSADFDGIGFTRGQITIEYEA